MAKNPLHVGDRHLRFTGTGRPPYDEDREGTSSPPRTMALGTLDHHGGQPAARHRTWLTSRNRPYNQEEKPRTTRTRLARAGRRYYSKSQ
jgi:hypothetical protein